MANTKTTTLHYWNFTQSLKQALLPFVKNYYTKNMHKCNKMRTFQYLQQMILPFLFFCSGAISLLCQSRLGFQPCFLLLFRLLLMLANIFLKVFITTSVSRCFTKIQLLRKAESNSGDTRRKFYFPRPWIQCIFSYHRSWHIIHCTSPRAQHKHPLIRSGPQLCDSDCKDELNRTILGSALNLFPASRGLQQPSCQLEFYLHQKLLVMTELMLTTPLLRE